MQQILEIHKHSSTESTKILSSVTLALITTSTSTLINQSFFNFLSSPNSVFPINQSISMDMATALSTTTVLSCRNPRQHMHIQPSSLCNSSTQNGISISRTVAAKESCLVNGESEEGSSLLVMNRRTVLASGFSLLGFPGGSLAVVKQGPLAGRIPGLSEPDEEGWRTYRRPDEKSGGHGVGWSPIIPYTFSVPQEWEEVPVSIADLGGTEIDLRFASSKEGRLFVVVAPVLRFADNLGDDATIEKIGTPDKVISAFGPEMVGQNVEGKVLSSSVTEHEGKTYYQFELEPPHIFITATAAGNRLYLFGVTGNGLQWKRHYNDLKKIADSFRVV